MSTAVLNEIVEKVAVLTRAERDELFRLLQEEKSKVEEHGKKGFVHPNTIWIKEHHREYAGKHVALKDGELVAFGDTIKEADVKAKEKGVKNSMLAYLPREDEELWGGW